MADIFKCTTFISQIYCYFAENQQILGLILKIGIFAVADTF